VLSARRSGLLQNSGFLCLWSAQTVSAAGSQVSALALPWIAVTFLHASAFEVSALFAVEHAPFALVSLPAGVWVDRLRRRPVLIVCDWVRCGTLATVPTVYWAGALTLWQLYVVGVVVGTMTVVFSIAYQAHLPSLVGREQLPEANAKLELTSAGAQVGGPGLAGLLIAAVTAPYAVCVDAVSFAVSAIFIGRIRAAEPLAADGSTRRCLVREVRDGLSFVIRHPYMRPMMLAGVVSNFFTNALWALVLVYAVRALGLSSSEVGLMFALGSVGFVVGALVARRAADGLGIGPAIVCGGALANCGWFLIPVASPSTAVPLISAALFLFGLGSTTLSVSMGSLFQAITPDRMLGRTTASRRFAILGVVPLGSLAGGALAAAVGLHRTLWICALGAVLAFVPLLLSRIPTVRTLADAESFL
jgi:MFS family permease